MSTKIIIGFISVFATVALVTGFVLHRAMKREMYNAVEASASNLAVTITSLVQENPELLHSNSLPRTIQRFSPQLRDLERVVIYDPERRVIANSDLGSSRGRAMDPGPFSMVVAGEGEGYFAANGRKFYRLVKPIVGAYDAPRKTNVIGIVSVDMQLSPVEGRITQNVLNDIRLRVALLTLFGTFLYLYTRRVFVRPLVELASAADRLEGRASLHRSIFTAETSSRLSPNLSTAPSRSDGEATTSCARATPPMMPIEQKANSSPT